MTSDENHPELPLTKALLPSVPWYARWFGRLNNRRNESAVNTVLAGREERAVMGAWRDVLPDDVLAQRVLAAVGTEIGWHRPLFIPQDEFFVVMKLWWGGVADCMERERCFWALQKVFGVNPSASFVPDMIDKTLGDFVTRFWDDRGPKTAGNG